MTFTPIFGFDFKDKKSFGPANTYLITSLLSGLTESFKYNLSSSPVQYSYIEDGLNAFDNSSICELLLIGASGCIQMLTNGSYIIPTAKPFIQCANEVALKLKFQKSTGKLKRFEFAQAPRYFSTIYIYNINLELIIFNS